MNAPYAAHDQLTETVHRPFAPKLIGFNRAVVGYHIGHMNHDTGDSLEGLVR